MQGRQVALIKVLFGCCFLKSAEKRIIFTFNCNVMNCKSCIQENKVRMNRKFSMEINWKVIYSIKYKEDVIDSLSHKESIREWGRSWH